MSVFDSSGLKRNARRSRTTEFRAPEIRAFLPFTEKLLVKGGDDRLRVDSQTGTNRYGCMAKPSPGLLSFGSSTASTISERGFAAANRLRREMTVACGTQSTADYYQEQMNRVRQELLGLCGIEDLNVESIFAASGTDLHLIASQFVVDQTQPTFTITVESSETGSRVPTALAGGHFSFTTAIGEAVFPLAYDIKKKCHSLVLRDENGGLRSKADIDEEVKQAVRGAVAEGRQVLLNLVDVSKTGMIAPSVDCALALKKQFLDKVIVLADCCQGRVSSHTIRQYLKSDVLVALTGSKFIGGPSFSGVLLIPEALSSRLEQRSMAPMLKQYCAQGEWPSHWAASADLIHKANFGLLLRWQAALEEWHAFKSVPEEFIFGFLNDFSSAVKLRLQEDASFEILPTHEIDRGLINAGVDNGVKGWDQVQTIFPFILCRRKSVGGRTPISHEETLKVYRAMPEGIVDCSTIDGSTSTNKHIAHLRCQLGQPVPCGLRGETSVSALRLCVGARTIVEAYRNGSSKVVEQAMSVLNKVSWLGEFQQR